MCDFKLLPAKQTVVVGRLCVTRTIRVVYNAALLTKLDILMPTILKMVNITTWNRQVRRANMLVSTIIWAARTYHNGQYA